MCKSHRDGITCSRRLTKHEKETDISEVQVKRSSGSLTLGTLSENFRVKTNLIGLQDNELPFLELLMEQVIVIESKTVILMGG